MSAGGHLISFKGNWAICSRSVAMVELMGGRELHSFVAANENPPLAAEKRKIDSIYSMSKQLAV